MTPSVLQGMNTSRNLPERGSLRASDFQDIVSILQLKIHENQSNGVPGLGQDGPGAVCIVAILQGEVRAGDDPALAPQGPSAGIVSCNKTRGVSPDVPGYNVKMCPKVCFLSPPGAVIRISMGDISC